MGLYDLLGYLRHTMYMYTVQRCALPRYLYRIITIASSYFTATFGVELGPN